MNKNFKNFAKIILILAIAIATFALSSCTNGRSVGGIELNKKYGEYRIDIYPFEYEGHGYLYFETSNGEPLGVTENPKYKTK